MENERIGMINVTRLNHSLVVLNSDLIECIENTPDTVITLSSDRKISIRETAEEVVGLVRAWRRSLLAPDFAETMIRKPREVCKPHESTGIE